MPNSIKQAVRPGKYFLSSMQKLKLNLAKLNSYKKVYQY